MPARNNWYKYREETNENIFCLNFYFSKAFTCKLAELPV